MVIALLMLSMTTSQVFGYSSEITVGTEIEWHIDAAPSDAFNMFYTGGGDWLAENGSSMTFAVTNIGEDVEGQFVIGNVSVISNDTEIAKDLTLGVWGLTEWWPGLVVDVSHTAIESLNATAYASAARVSGNFLNGTMTSRFENISVGNVLVECIVFNFVQDESGFGEPQVTQLAYSIGRGLLVSANTSYSFGVPYNLQIRLVGSGLPLVDPLSGFYPILIAGALLVVLVVVYGLLSRRS